MPPWELTHKCSEVGKPMGLKHQPRICNALRRKSAGEKGEKQNEVRMSVTETKIPNLKKTAKSTCPGRWRRKKNPSNPTWLDLEKDNRNRFAATWKKGVVYMREDGRNKPKERRPATTSVLREQLSTDAEQNEGREYQSNQTLYGSRSGFESGGENRTAAGESYKSSSWIKIIEEIRWEYPVRLSKKQVKKAERVEAVTNLQPWQRSVARSSWNRKLSKSKVQKKPYKSIKGREINEQAH